MREVVRVPRTRGSFALETTVSGLRRISGAFGDEPPVVPATVAATDVLGGRGRGRSCATASWTYPFGHPLDLRGPHVDRAGRPGHRRRRLGTCARAKALVWALRGETMSNPAVVARVERVAERAGSPKAALRVVGPGRAAKRARWAWSSCVKSRNAIIMVAMMARPLECGSLVAFGEAYDARGYWALRCERLRG